MTERIEVLDHGYVELVEHYGSDERIIEAARMSTAKGFKGWGPYCPKCEKYEVDTTDSRVLGMDKLCPPCGERLKKGDEKLLSYLWKNKHATPFEMAGMIIEVKAPIFIYRQWHRHRTQSYNEMSARYTPLPDENYVPSVERLMLNAGKNKQARAAGDVELEQGDAEVFQAELTVMYHEQERFYRRALHFGVPKELARCHVGVGRYSKMRAAANLRNWLAFLTLRMDSHAQWEIQQYANAVGALIAERFPRTWELFIGKK